MLITKRSRRPSDRFDSRFKDGAGVDFPVRQYLRCREDLASGLVHVVLLAAFVTTLVIFGRTLIELFDTQGAHLNPWYKRGAIILLALFILSVGRRLYYKVVELREIRREMGLLKDGFRAPLD